MAQLVQKLQRTRLSVSGTAASNGNNTVIAAVNGARIVITDVVLQNESTTATTMILQDGAGGSALLRCLGQNQGDGIGMVYADDSRPATTVSNLLNLNLSGANSCGYTIGYYLG